MYKIIVKFLKGDPPIISYNSFIHLKRGFTINYIFVDCRFGNLTEYILKLMIYVI